MPLSLQEILDKTEKTRKDVEHQLDLTNGGFHPEEASIYAGLSQADKQGIYETLRSVSLRTLVEKLNLKEYFGPSTTLTTGITAVAGAPYVIPDKIYADLFEAARGMDLTPLISNVVDTPGATLKIDAEIGMVPGSTLPSYMPKFAASGGEPPTETMAIAQGTITPRTFSISPQITNDMIEDSQFELMERHISIAGRAMGDFSTKMCLYPVMDDHRATATTYRVTGSYNTVNAGGTYNYTSDIMEAIEANYLDGWISDVLILPPTLGVSTLFTGAGAGTPINQLDIMKINLASQEITPGPFGLRTYVHINDDATLYAPAAVKWYSGLYTTTWHALVMNQKNGIQTVRKKWLKIERYSDPIKDLQGCVISARQGHLVARADAVCVISHA